MAPVSKVKTSIPISDEDVSIIKNNYLTSSHPTAYSSPGNIKRFYGKRFSKKTIAKALAAIDSYTLHREFKKPKYTNPIYVYSLREQVQMDLIDMQPFAKFNDGINYVMVAIDTFSKKAWVKAMTNKSASVSLAKIKELVAEIKPKMKAVFLDRGTEFKNKFVQAFLREQNIKMIHPYSETKAAGAERFNRTLKNLIYRHFGGKTYKYIDVLDDLVSSYNNRGHSTLQYLTPNDAEKEENKSKVLCALNMYYTKAVGGVRRHPVKYQVGQKVRIQASIGKLDRGFQETFKDEPFEIVSINTRMPIPMYRIKSLNDNEIVRGGFYANNLQPIEGTVFKLTVLKEEVRRGKKRYFVKWQGFDDSHNSWVDESAITESYD
jgi:hypothetical protein